MPLSVKTSNQAELDIAEAAVYLSRDSIEAMLDFIDAINQTIELLGPANRLA